MRSQILRRPRARPATQPHVTSRRLQGGCGHPPKQGCCHIQATTNASVECQTHPLQPTEMKFPELWLSGKPYVSMPHARSHAGSSCHIKQSRNTGRSAPSKPLAALLTTCEKKHLQAHTYPIAPAASRSRGHEAAWAPYQRQVVDTPEPGRVLPVARIATMPRHSADRRAAQVPGKDNYSPTTRTTRKRPSGYSRHTPQLIRPSQHFHTHFLIQMRGTHAECSTVSALPTILTLQTMPRPVCKTHCHSVTPYPKGRPRRTASLNNLNKCMLLSSALFLPRSYCVAVPRATFVRRCHDRPSISARSFWPFGLVLKLPQLAFSGGRDTAGTSRLPPRQWSNVQELNSKAATAWRPRVTLHIHQASTSRHGELPCALSAEAERMHSTLHGAKPQSA